VLRTIASVARYKRNPTGAPPFMTIAVYNDLLEKRDLGA
jgi:hypothetical protein